MKPLKISLTCSEKQLWLCGNSALFTQPPCLSSALFCRLQSSCDELLHEPEFTQLSLKANSHWGKLIPNLADGFFLLIPFPFLLWGLSLMTSAKVLDFLPLPFLVRKFTQPPLLCRLLKDPHPPSSADVINGRPLSSNTDVCSDG